MHMDGDLIEPIPDRRLVEAEYSARQDAYHGYLAALERQIRVLLERAGLKPTIKGRVKSFDSLYKKQLRLLRSFREEGSKPLALSDVIGLRIVCPFLGDLSTAEAALRSELSIVEVERKGAERSFKEFGYESIHLLAKLPERLSAELGPLNFDLFEIQLRTILQEAWAEVEHELVYKAELTPFDEPLKRKLAALNANLSLSDIIFQEIRDYQHRLGSELHSRREAFYAKIEEAVDGSLVVQPAQGAAGPPSEGGFEGLPFSGATNIDDLLLDALYAHNRKNYVAAIENYRSILSNALAPEIASVVHKHRGMAYFSESRYEEAIGDFGRALELNPKCYKSAYFRGVVRSVIGAYGEAISDFCLSLSINPYQFFALYRRGQAYWHIGDFPKALSDCEEALKIEPGSRQAMELRHLALEKLRM
ncbi:MAG: tetratricopeptide repeat protein [Spirochaetota bacterium]